MKFIEYVQTVIAALFIIGMLWYGMSITYEIFHPTSEKVQLEIIGVINATNATTLTSLHFECIKMCKNQFYNDGSKLNSCWQQCSGLGKELWREEEK